MSAPPGPWTQVYVGVGSNIEPEANIERALGLLARRTVLTGLSTFYRTAPVGPAGQPAFVNGVAGLRANLPARELKFSVLRGIEADLGRKHSAANKYLPRPIDLDILLYGELVSRAPELLIPDPDLWERPFLAAMLLELAPDVRFPGSRRPPCLKPGKRSRGNTRPLEAFSRRLREKFILRRSPDET